MSTFCKREFNVEQRCTELGDNNNAFGFSPQQQLKTFSKRIVQYNVNSVSINSHDFANCDYITVPGHTKSFLWRVIVPGHI